MCGQWGSNGLYSKSKIQKGRKEFTEREWMKVIDELSEFNPKPIIIIWGGEPLLVDYFGRLLKYIKDRNFFVKLNTNGVYLKKFAAAFVKNRLDVIALSLDGTEKTHERIRNTKGIFKKIEEGVKEIVHLEKRYNLKAPLIVDLFTITKQNSNELKLAVEQAKRWGLDGVIFQMYWYTTSELAEKQKTTLMKEFNIKDTSAYSWIIDKWDDYVDNLGKKLIGLREKRKDFFVRTSPSHITGEEVREWYRNPYNTFGKTICHAPFRRANILPDGGVSFCVDFPDVIIGNIKENSLRNIWYSPRADKFRALIGKRLLPVCYRCCWLYMEKSDYRKKEP